MCQQDPEHSDRGGTEIAAKYRKTSPPPSTPYPAKPNEKVTLKTVVVFSPPLNLLLGNVVGIIEQNYTCIISHSLIQWPHRATCNSPVELTIRPGKLDLDKLTFGQNGRDYLFLLAIYCYLKWLATKLKYLLRFSASFLVRCYLWCPEN